MDYLERKFGKYAVRNLMKIIAIGMLMVYVLAFFSNDFIDNLGFSWKYIIKGQVWRLITFIFVPESTGIFAIFYFLVLMFFGNIIESYYGSFKLNLYVLVGCLGTIVSNLLIEKITGTAFPVTNSYLYLSLMLLAATVAPDFELRLYFLIPVKLKYLAIFYGFITMYMFLTGKLLSKILIGFSLLNYILFVVIYFAGKQKRYIRKYKYSKELDKNRKKAKPKSKAKIIEVAFHCCEVCGKTEKDDPSLEFRYCSKCDGAHEYCNHHIKDHEHIKGED